jgi:Tol biopolymer transport system component
MRVDAQTDTTDIWTYDVASARAPPSRPAAKVRTPGLAPDGQHVAYVATAAHYSSVYRKASSGQGAEEQLFRYTPGAGMVLTDFSADGKFLTFDGGGIVLIVPLTGDDPLKRQGVDFARSEFEAGLGRFSPDGRLIAYALERNRPLRSIRTPVRCGLGVCVRRAEVESQRRWRDRRHHLEQRTAASSTT